MAGKNVEKKQCFLISPIGIAGTDTRILADKVKNFLEYEVLHDLNYKCIRGDEINRAGNITSDVIRRIIESDLVIAFLDESNANVYYELALRHAVAKICFSIMASNHKIPFDVYQERVFKFPVDDMKDYSYSKTHTLAPELAALKTDLITAIEEYNEQEYEVSNPITVATHKVFLPKTMTMDAMMEHLDDRFQDLQSSFESRFHSLDAVLRDWMPDNVRLAVKDMYQNGSAIYIDGENEAFAKLTEMTLTATRSLRTSRFAPQAIGNTHSDFFHAVCSFGKKKGVECKRIMGMNEIEKEADILKTVLDTSGGSMDLYLTDQDNNFELVVIDDTCAFLHFYDDRRHIKSTLFIRGQRVVKEFEKIYDRMVDDGFKKGEHKWVVIKCSDYSSPIEIMEKIPKIIAQFKKQPVTSNQSGK